jgi:hypothetical protein
MKGKELCSSYNVEAFIGLYMLFYNLEKKIVSGFKGKYFRSLKSRRLLTIGNCTLIPADTAGQQPY